MDREKLTELSRLQVQIEELANGERFGANHYDYPLNINHFEVLVERFYCIASEMDCSIKVMRDILDGRHSLNRQFMHLRSRQCVNKFEAMKCIYSEIEQIMNELK